MRYALRNKRKEARLTQGEVAKALHISRPTYCKIENGTTDPSLALALRIAAFFNCSVEDLFSDNKFFDVKSPTEHIA
ncbi:MAG: helix-turn-helix transcriptional regulator [Moorellaceae bacterium]